MIVLHIFTEEPSARSVFNSILEQILPKEIEYNIYSHQGKQDLEKALKTTLPSISKMPGARILITRDQDNEDCIILKHKINELVKQNIGCDYRIRIICKELESWYLGDLNAISLAYPRFKPSKYINKSSFRSVDEISKPSEYLLKIVPELQKNKTLPKIIVSETIAPFLEIENNKSCSFINTISAIQQLISI